MSFDLVVFLIVLSLTIITLFLVIFINPPVPTSLASQIFTNTGWSSEVNAAQGERGTCLLYTTFTKDKRVVDNLVPLGKESETTYCADGFLQALQLVSQRCNVGTCRGNDGNSYQAGEFQEYYTTCGNLQLCGNPRSLIMFSYSRPVNSNTSCILFRNGIFTSTILNPFTIQEDQFVMSITNSVVNSLPNLSKISTGPTVIYGPYTNISLVLRNGNITTGTIEEGYVWLYTIDFYITKSETERLWYPSQLVYMEGIDVNEYRDNLVSGNFQAIADMITGKQTLNSNGRNLILLESKPCNVIVNSSAPVDQTEYCKQLKTEILPAYSWNILFG